MREWTTRGFHRATDSLSDNRAECHRGRCNGLCKGHCCYNMYCTFLSLLFQGTGNGRSKKCILHKITPSIWDHQLKGSWNAYGCVMWGSPWKQPRRGMYQEKERFTDTLCCALQSWCHRVNWSPLLPHLIHPFFTVKHRKQRPLRKH